MAKVAPRNRGMAELADHGRALEEAAKRLRLHTDTLAATLQTEGEAGRSLDERIILLEANAIMARVIAILAITTEAR